MKRTPPGPCSRPSETLPPTMPGMGRALGTTTWQSCNFTVTPKRQKSHMPLVGFKVAITDHNHDLSGVAIYSWYMLLQQKFIRHTHIKMHSLFCPRWDLRPAVGPGSGWTQPKIWTSLRSKVFVWSRSHKTGRGSNEDGALGPSL